MNKWAKDKVQRCNQEYECNLLNPSGIAIKDELLFSRMEFEGHVNGLLHEKVMRNSAFRGRHIQVRVETESLIYIRVNVKKHGRELKFTGISDYNIRIVVAIIIDRTLIQSQCKYK